jgi:spermidine synthase
VTSPVAVPLPGSAPVAEPGRSRAARATLLFATFVCAACGLVYELALVAQGSYLLGDSVTQTSVVLAVMVFAMGLGSLAAKPLQRHAALSFARVEALLALTGGLSVLGLHAAFAWWDLYWPALITISLAVGALIGAEIPLLMTLLQRIRRQDAGSATADLFAADYVGALIGGLAFPFLLLPVLGLTRGALAVGVVNVLAGAAVVFGLFGRELSRRDRLAGGAATLAVLAVLGVAAAGSATFQRVARAQLYADPVVHAQTSRYQEIVLTRSAPFAGPADTRLFLDGDLQFSSLDEYRYHEALVHPVMAGEHQRVLVLGGGDGLALREVLRYPDLAEVVEVELDPAVLALARTRLAGLNGGSLDDPRVQVVVADAFRWLRESEAGRFDAVIVDMPDPDATATAKLYSTEFYALVRRVLTPDGRMVVQAGSPYFAPRTFSCILATIRSAGLGAVPYHVDVPSMGDWGFVLTGLGTAPPLRADTPEPLRFLSDDVLQAAAVFPADRVPTASLPSTLDDPRVIRVANSEWRRY